MNVAFQCAWIKTVDNVNTGMAVYKELQEWGAGAARWTLLSLRLSRNWSRFTSLDPQPSYFRRPGARAVQFFRLFIPARNDPKQIDANALSVFFWIQVMDRIIGEQ